LVQRDLANLDGRDPLWAIQTLEMEWPRPIAPPAER